MFHGNCADAAASAALTLRPLGLGQSVGSSVGLHLEERVLVDRLLHLQGVVVDVVIVAEQELDLPAGTITILASGDDDVGSEHLKSGGDRPDVKLVNGAHPAHRADRASD